MLLFIEAVVRNLNGDIVYIIAGDGKEKHNIICNNKKMNYKFVYFFLVRYLKKKKRYYFVRQIYLFSQT